MDDYAKRLREEAGGLAPFEQGEPGDFVCDTHSVRTMFDAADEIERLQSALSVFGKVSMFETRPARHEYHIGWQDVDGQYGVKKSDIEAAMNVARSFSTKKS